MAFTISAQQVVVKAPAAATRRAQATVVAAAPLKARRQPPQPPRTLPHARAPRADAPGDSGRSGAARVRGAIRG
jgi:hypothetical protein